jgi:hypothetical protein
MNPQLEAFTLLLQAAAPAFTQPSFAIFSELICAWVLCPARRTVTARNVSRVLRQHLFSSSEQSLSADAMPSLLLAVVHGVRSYQVPHQAWAPTMTT